MYTCMYILVSLSLYIYIERERDIEVLEVIADSSRSVFTSRAPAGPAVQRAGRSVGLEWVWN